MLSKRCIGQARQNASYALLSDDEDDDAAPVHAAPTTAPVQKPAKQKKLRKVKVSWPAAPWRSDLGCLLSACSCLA